MLWKPLRYQVAASLEHIPVLHSLDYVTAVDIGANRGQFSLAAKYCRPNAVIISFEPLLEPSLVYRKVFHGNKSVKLHQSAIGPEKNICNMHVSSQDDSSSLLPISSLQVMMFPGTQELNTVNVEVAPLDNFVSENDIVTPALLKLDVQGYELDALRGCESMLHRFDWVYCECSFVELYSGQKLAADVISWLFDRRFRMQGIHNPIYDRSGQTIQADFLFQRVE